MSPKHSLHNYLLPTTPRFRRLLYAVLVLTTAIPLHVPAWAIDFADAAADAAAVSDLSSPRGTFNTFMEAMIAVRGNEEALLPVALQCLYLDELPESERSTRGAEMANQLYSVLDKAGVKLDGIPAEPEGKTVSIQVGEDAGQNVVLREYDDGNWRFSYDQTLKSVATLDDAVTQQQSETPPQEALDPVLKSPRDTMATFLSGMNRWRQDGIQKAVSTLDLSQIGKNVRAQTGRELAVKLKRVLDRDRRVQIADIPNYTKSEPYIHLLAPSGSIVIDLVTDAQTGKKAWKFTSKTMDSLGLMYDVFKERPLAEGIARDTTPTLLSMTIRDTLNRHAPFLLRRTAYFENWQWFGMLATIFAGMFLSRIVGYCLIAIVHRIFAKRNYELDQALGHGFVRPIRLALMAWVWLLGLNILGLPASAYVMLNAGAQMVTVASVVWMVFRLIDIVQLYVADKSADDRSRFDDLFVSILSRTVKLICIVAGFVFIAEALDVDYMSVLAGVGLGGLALALAAKDTLGNIFGSLTILMDRPFQIGDYVKVRDIEGTVESVGIRSTRIRTFYSSLVSVPNSEVITATLDNFGARRYRRVMTTISVTYDTPPEKIEAFCEGIRQVITKNPNTRKDEIYVNFHEFSAHSLDILLYCFLDVKLWETELRERDRLFLDIIRLANRLGVQFAFPTQTLYIGRNTGKQRDNRIPPFEQEAS